MINCIFASDGQGNMGFNGTLPWSHNAEDMARFQQLTNGHIVVMGRNTWDDPKMPKPLPGRTNFVFSHRPIGVPGVQILRGDVVTELQKLENAYPKKQIFVIGGKALIESSSIICDYLYLTHMKGLYRSDVRIHLDKYLSGFRAITAEPSEDRSCTFMVYKNRFRL
jgi:dihydrofolate reductase